MLPDKQRKHWEFISSALPNDLTGKSVLDFGCGGGELASHLIGTTRAEKVVAVDISAKAITQTTARLARYPQHRFEVILIDGFELSPSMYDIIIFNPPMVPNEQGFFKGSGYWCFLHFLEWMSGNDVVAYVMLFDYCREVLVDGKRKQLTQHKAAQNLDSETIKTEPRIVNDDSPIWIHKDKIRDWFPCLRFVHTTVEESSEPKRTIERSIVRISTKISVRNS